MKSRQRMDPKLLIAPAILLALASGSCGGGSSTAATARTNASTVATSSTGTGSSRAAAPSTASFIARADVICRQVNKQLAAANAKNASIPEIVRVAPRNAAIERKGLAELEKLAVPGAISVTWQSILADRTTLFKQLTELTEIARRKDTAAIRTLGASKKRLHAELRKAAKQGGFKDCATVG